MRFLISPLMLVSIVLVACSSSKDSGTPTGTPAADSGTPGPTPTSEPEPVAPIPVTIQGDGRVVTKDASLDCVSDGTTQSGKCSVMHPGDVLYASHGYNWTFDHWEPSGVEDSTLFIPLRDGPDAVTAVFRNLATSPADAGSD